MSAREYLLSALDTRTWEEKRLSSSKSLEKANSLVGPVDFISVIAVPISILTLSIGFIFSYPHSELMMWAALTISTASITLLFGLCKFQGHKQGMAAQVLKLARPMQWFLLVSLGYQLFNFFWAAFL